MATVPDAVTRDLASLRELTGKVVGSVFFGSMLKMMRESKIKGPVGHGGRGEEVFAGQLHGVLAERMGARERGGVVEALYGRLARQQHRISGVHAELARQVGLDDGSGSTAGRVKA